MMKPIQNFISRITIMIVSIFFSMAAFAQEKGADIDVDINKNADGGNWYAQPWVWIVGVAVFILLLVALLRGNRRVD